jgi:hypothetical protein
VSLPEGHMHESTRCLYYRSAESGEGNTMSLTLAIQYHWVFLSVIVQSVPSCSCHHHPHHHRSFSNTCPNCVCHNICFMCCHSFVFVLSVANRLNVHFTWVRTSSGPTVPPRVLHQVQSCRANSISRASHSQIACVFVSAGVPSTS